MKARSGEQFYPAECKRRKDDPGRRRNPPPWALTKLPPKYEFIVQLMIYGLEVDAVIEGAAIAAGTPLSLRQAARHVGVRLRGAREIADTALFQTAFNKTLLALRRAEGPRNLHTAIEIRDDPGDGSAATKRARLSAIDSIEGKSSTGTQISVNVAQQTTINPGYVIKLPATSSPVIDSTAIERD